MTRLLELRLASSFGDVAKILKFKKSKSLAYILYKMAADDKYKKFEIPKRSGGTRKISAPNAELKRTQRELATLLQDCVEEINTAAGRGDDQLKPDRIAHGFKRRRSIITNAVEHRNRRYVFNIDIEDFFGSINFGRVRGFFIKDKNFSLSPSIATLLAQIACFENNLPQGSPSSPVISNLITHILDIHLANLAKREGVTYTRYADDLTFSTNKKNFPERIAAIVPESGQWNAGKELLRLTARSGFKINPSKTRMQFNESRQEVTGLVVNKYVNAPLEYRHRVRAMVHSLVTTGKFEFISRIKDGSGALVEIKTPGKPEQLRGMIDYVATVNRRGILSPHPQLSNIERLYRKFLIFREFFASDRPVIICEGKTDNVYLAHAARSLHKNHPLLASSAADGKIALLFRRHRYPTKTKGRVAARLLGLHGGTAQLNGFIGEYQSELKHIRAPGGTQPVIILIDNDSGADPIYGRIKNLKHITPTRNEEFIHLFANLYVVATPLGGAKSSAIEDLFDAKTKSKLIGGKPFDPTNDFETSTHYGKSVFAHKVVETDAASIDFSGFSPLLTRIEKVLQYHSTLMASAVTATAAVIKP